MDRALIQETVDTLRFAAAPLLHTRRQPREAVNGEAAERKPIGDAADSFLLEVSKVSTAHPKALVWSKLALPASPRRACMWTQVAIMCGAGGSVPTTEAASLLQAVQQRFTALCAALHGILACQEAGPTLREMVSAAADGLLDASTAFVNSLTDQVAYLHKTSPLVLCWKLLHG